MKDLSLTARMSLLFMLAVTGVLTLAGVVFTQLSQHHFEVLDRHLLEDKRAAFQALIERRDTMDAGALEAQLTAMLDMHSDVAARVALGERTLYFGQPELASLLARQAARPDARWEIAQSDRLYRGISLRLPATGQAPQAALVLALDVTNHRLFFETLRRWFWIGLIVCALASAGLGWLVAHNGLRPLQRITHLATSVSARSLQERVPLEPVPAELRQLMESFNAMLARLEESFLRLSHFSADIAHELRTPVSNLMTHTEVTLSKPRDKAVYEDTLYANLDEFKRMARMIDDMLFLAKADNGLITPEYRPVELRALVEGLFDYYHLLADEHAIVLQIEGDGQALGDRLMLHRAIANLRSNALRHTPPGQWVRVAIEPQGDWLRLSVANGGPTIAEEHLTKLFDRFYRADPARREGQGNAGLGLAITRSIILAHRGRLSCHSACEVTTFELLLPAAPRHNGGQP